MRSSSVRVVSYLIVIAAAACGTDIVFGVPAPGSEASVVETSVRAAGGRVHRSNLVIDSTTSRFELVNCEGGVTGECVESQRVSGDVHRDRLAELFELAQSRAFRALKDEYRISGDVVPPDGGSTSLKVTVGDREKTIAVEHGASVPEVLTRFLCLTRAIHGTLLLCD
jgi:hypothetical protein